MDKYGQHIVEIIDWVMSFNFLLDKFGRTPLNRPVLWDFRATTGPVHSQDETLIKSILSSFSCAPPSFFPAEQATELVPPLQRTHCSGVPRQSILSLQHHPYACDRSSPFSSKFDDCDRWKSLGSFVAPQVTLILAQKVWHLAFLSSDRSLSCVFWIGVALI